MFNVLEYGLKLTFDGEKLDPGDDFMSISVCISSSFDMFQSSSQSSFMLIEVLLLFWDRLFVVALLDLVLRFLVVSDLTLLWELVIFEGRRFLSREER